MVFYGAYFEFDQSKNTFRIRQNLVEAVLHGRDGSRPYQIVLHNPASVGKPQIYSIVSPFELHLDKDSHSFIWSITLESATSFFCFRFCNLSQFSIFERAITSILRISKSQLLHEAIRNDLCILNLPNLFNGINSEINQEADEISGENFSCSVSASSKKTPVESKVKSKKKRISLKVNSKMSPKQIVKVYTSKDSAKAFKSKSLSTTAESATLSKTTKKSSSSSIVITTTTRKINTTKTSKRSLETKSSLVRNDILKLTADNDKEKAREFNCSFVMTTKNYRTGPKCHICLQKKFPMLLCPNEYKEHSTCSLCLMSVFSIALSDLQNGILTWNCLLCEEKCDCNNCKIHKKKKEKIKADRFSNPLQDNCCLCNKKSLANSPLVLHPMVTKDSQGNPIKCCTYCLEKVVTRRENYFGSRLRGDHQEGEDHQEEREDHQEREDICTLCASDGLEDSIKLFACSGDKCRRSYCKNCLKILLDDQKMKELDITENWIYNNCMCCEVNCETKPENSNLLVLKKNKEILPPVNPLMDATDYTAQYIKFVIKRESNLLPCTESEDSCFCCKDGGIVIECDWQRNSNKQVPCPKVYHIDCLGFDIPDNVKWICPRHTCFFCPKKPLFSCRFCPVSFCEKHITDDILRIGKATKDISKCVYVLCNKCNSMRLEAVKRKSLEKDEGIIDIQEKNKSLIDEENKTIGSTAELGKKSSLLAVSWSLEEKERYNQALELYYGKWEKLAEMVQTKNAEECRYYHLKEAVKRIPWRQDEISRYLEAMNLPGKRDVSFWELVTKKVGTRSIHACRAFKCENAILRAKEEQSRNLIENGKNSSIELHQEEERLVSPFELMNEEKTASKEKEQNNGIVALKDPEITKDCEKILLKTTRKDDNERDSINKNNSMIKVQRNNKKNNFGFLESDNLRNHHNEKCLRKKKTIIKSKIIPLHRSNIKNRL